MIFYILCITYLDEAAPFRRREGAVPETNNDNITKHTSCIYVYTYIFIHLLSTI